MVLIIVLMSALKKQSMALISKEVKKPWISLDKMFCSQMFQQKNKLLEKLLKTCRVSNITLAYSCPPMTKVSIQARPALKSEIKSSTDQNVLKAYRRSVPNHKMSFLCHQRPSKVKQSTNYLIRNGIQTETARPMPKTVQAQPAQTLL